MPPFSHHFEVERGWRIHRRTTESNCAELHRCVPVDVGWQCGGQGFKSCAVPKRPTDGVGRVSARDRTYAQRQTSGRCPVRTVTVYQWSHGAAGTPVSYTHLTLPTNREV